MPAAPRGSFGPGAGRKRGCPLVPPGTGRRTGQDSGQDRTGRDGTADWPCDRDVARGLPSQERFQRPRLPTGTRDGL